MTIITDFGHSEIDCKRKKKKGEPYQCSNCNITGDYT